MKVGVGCFGSPMPRLIGPVRRTRRDVRGQRAQALERIGMQAGEQRVHVSTAPADEGLDARHQRTANPVKG
jgi:hypothetical protein